MKTEIERIQNENDIIKETIASMDGPEREVNVEILAENANLISQLEEERGNMRRKELEYEETKKNYIHFKCRAEGLAKYINNQGKEGAVEIEKLDKELSKAMKMKCKLENDCRETRDKLDVLQTELENMKISHEDKMKIMEEENEEIRQ